MGRAIEEYLLPDLMKKIEATLNENPGPIQGFQVSYQFEIKDTEVETYQLHIKDGAAIIQKENEETAECILQMSLKSFQQFIVEKLNGTMAFMTGKLKIKGDMGKALKLEGILRQYNVQEHL